MDNYNLQLMTKKLKMAVVMLFMLPLCLHAQDNPSVTDSKEIPQDYKDTWKSPYITDEMTVDPEQHKSWRMGEYKFPAKPKHSWEFGLHLGHFLIDGDVDRNILGGYGLGLHLRKAMNYSVSIRASLFYGVATGLEKQPSRHRNNVGANGIGGGLVEEVFNDYDPMRGGPGEWFPAYRTSYVSGDIAAIFNIGNLLFHRERNKWNLYFGLGIGLNTHTTMLDLLNSNGLPYDALSQRVNWTPEDFDTKSGRSRIKEELMAIYDGDYETEGPKKDGVFRMGDEMNIHMAVIPSVGISRKINKRINIGIEHAVYLSDTDYLDGIKFRTSADQTNNLDVGHYTHVRIGVNIGNFQKVTEPLYWVNPIDQAYTDIANLKSQESLDFADEDNDGVIDIIDQELDTPEDCPVDTRGIILDSDGDGIVDCEDKEPYSRPGCPVDALGVAQCDDVQAVDADQVRSIVDERIEELQLDSYTQPTASNNSNDVQSSLQTRSDGTEFFVLDNADGSTTTTSRNPDGIVESIREYEDGSVTRVVQNPDGTKYAEITNSLGETSRITEAANGERTFLVNNPDGSTTESKVDSEGRVESRTNYPDGSVRLTIREPDGSVTSDIENADGSITTTSQMADGSIKSMTRNVDGSTVMTTMSSDKKIERTVKMTDGTRKHTSMDEETGNLNTLIERPDGVQMFVTQRPDGVLIEKTDYPDGSYRKITQHTNGEITEEFLSADGTMTNKKQRPDGSQRVVVSNDGGIISDQEIEADNAESIVVTEKSFGLFAPNVPEMNEVNPSMPEVPDFPEANAQPVVETVLEETVPVQTTAPVQEREVIVTETRTIINSECGDWFLPMVHFDLNRYNIKPQYYGHLHNVAQVMRKCPDVCVVAQGHTDTRHSNNYNTVLSYRRAKAAVDYLVEAYDIDRTRIKLMYGGEETPMVKSASSEAQHFMNRRVEFRTCETGDVEMEVPEGYEQFIRIEQQNKKKESTYSKGNKASGY